MRRMNFTFWSIVFTNLSRVGYRLEGSILELGPHLSKEIFGGHTPVQKLKSSTYPPPGKQIEEEIFTCITLLPTISDFT